MKKRRIHPLLLVFPVLLLVVLSFGLFAASHLQPQAVNTSQRAPIRGIHQYTPRENIPHYRTQRLNGVDYLISPYPPGRFGGTLYQAAMGEGPKTLNGWAAYDAGSSAIASLLSCQPVQTHPHTGEVIPWVAKDIRISEDQRRITLVFRDGLKWSDGHPLSADDLLFTWNTIIGKGLGNPSTRDILKVNGQFPEMKPGPVPNSVVVETEVPYAPLLLNLGQSIAPKHIFEPLLKSGGEDAFGAAWSTQAAEQAPEAFVSCGPWVLEQYVPKQRIIFKRNPHYYVLNKKRQRLPYLAREVMTFAKDASFLQLLFEQGALHVHYASPQNLTRLQHLKQPDFNLVDLGASDGTTFMAFNLNPRNDENGQPIVPPAVQHWFQNRAFRQALNIAVNRQQLVNNVLKGVGYPLLTAFGLNSIYLNEEIAARRPYDVARAKSLLLENGFQFGPNGQLRDAQNRPVAFTITTNSGNFEREATLVQLQHDFKGLGIQANLQPVEFNTLVDRMKTGKWQAMVMGLSGGSNFEPHQSANVFKSDAALHLFNQRTPGALAKRDDRYPFEVQLDALYEAGTQTLDVEARREIYHQVQALLYAESPMVYLYSGKVILAIRDELKNVDATPLGGAQHNIESLWLSD